MALLSKVISWTGNGLDADQVITGVGFQPKAGIFFSSARGDSDGAFVDSSGIMVGIAGETQTGGFPTQYVVGFSESDAASTTSVRGSWAGTEIAEPGTGRISGGWIIATGAGIPGVSYWVKLISFNTDGITVRWKGETSTDPALYVDRFHAILFGGADITGAKAVQGTVPITGTSFSVTGAGFQPDFVFCIGGTQNPTTDEPTTSDNARIAFGCASSSARFWSMGCQSETNITMTAQYNMNKTFYTDSCLTMITYDADSDYLKIDLDSFDVDGATFGILLNPGATEKAWFLFIKGGKWEAGNKAKATVTGNDTFTLGDSTITPKSVLLGMQRNTVSGLVVASYEPCIGAAHSITATEQRVVGGCGVEAIATTTNKIRKENRIIMELTGGATPAVTSDATLNQMNAGNFVINWATNGGSAALVGYLVAGDAPVPTEVLKDPIYSGIIPFPR